MSGRKRVGRVSLPGRRGKQRPSPGYGIFAQESGRCLRNHADMPDLEMAVEIAERLFDAEADCELVLLWDYAGKQPLQVWRLTPTTLPRWEAQLEEEVAPATDHERQGSGTASVQP